MTPEIGKSSGKIRGRVENLKPFKPGQSGNPKGRPLGLKNFKTLFYEALKKLAKKEGVTPQQLELDLIGKGILSARAGDFRFYKDSLDRLHGSATQAIDLTSGGEPIEGFTYLPPTQK